MYTTQQPSANPYTRASSSRGRSSIPPPTTSGLRNITPPRSSHQPQYHHPHQQSDNSNSLHQQHQHGVTKRHFRGIPTHAMNNNTVPSSSSSPVNQHGHHQYEAAHFPAPSHISHISYVRRPTTQQTSELNRLHSPSKLRDISTVVAQGVKEEEQRAGHLLLREGRNVAGLSSPGLPVDVRRERLVGIISPEKKRPITSPITHHHYARTTTPRASDQNTNANSSTQNKFSKAFAMLRSPELVANAVRASQSVDRTVPPTSTIANYKNNSSYNQHPQHQPHRHFVGPVSAEMSRVVAASKSPPRTAISSSQHPHHNNNNNSQGVTTAPTTTTNTTTTVALTAVALQKAAELQQQQQLAQKVGGGGGGPSGRTSMAWSDAAPRNNQYNSTHQQQHNEDEEPTAPPSNLASTATPQYRTLATAPNAPTASATRHGGEGSFGVAATGIRGTEPSPIPPTAGAVFNHHADPQFQYLTTPNHRPSKDQGRPISPPSQMRSMSSQLQYPPPREAFFSATTPTTTGRHTTTTTTAAAVGVVDVSRIHMDSAHITTATNSIVDDHVAISNHIAVTDPTTMTPFAAPTTTTTKVGSNNNAVPTTSTMTSSTPDARRLVDACAEMFRPSTRQPPHLKERSRLEEDPLPTTPPANPIIQSTVSPTTTASDIDTSKPVTEVPVTIHSTSTSVLPSQQAPSVTHENQDHRPSAHTSETVILQQPTAPVRTPTNFATNNSFSDIETNQIVTTTATTGVNPTSHNIRYNPDTTTSTTTIAPVTFSDIPDGAEGVVYSNVATPVTSSIGTYPGQHNNTGLGCVDSQQQQFDKTPPSNNDQRDNVLHDGDNNGEVVTEVEENGGGEGEGHRVSSVSQPSSMFAVSPQTPSHARAESSHNVVTSPTQPASNTRGEDTHHQDQGKLVVSEQQPTNTLVVSTTPDVGEVRSPSPQVPTTTTGSDKKSTVPTTSTTSIDTAAAQQSVSGGPPSTSTAITAQAPSEAGGVSANIKATNESIVVSGGGIVVASGGVSGGVDDNEVQEKTTTRAQSYPPPPVERALHITPDDEVTSPLPAAYSSAPPVPQPRGGGGATNNYNNDAIPSQPASTTTSPVVVVNIVEETKPIVDNSTTTTSLVSNNPNDGTTSSVVALQLPSHKGTITTDNNNNTNDHRHVEVGEEGEVVDMSIDHDISIEADDDDYLDVVEDTSSSSSFTSSSSSSNSSLSSVPDTFNHSMSSSVDDRGDRHAGDVDGATASRRSSRGRGSTEIAPRSGRQSPLPPLSPRTVVPTQPKGNISRSVSGGDGSDVDSYEDHSTRPSHPPAPQPSHPPRSDFDEFIEIASNVESSLIAENLHDILNELVIEKEARGRKVLQIAQGCVWDILGLQTLWEPIYRTQLDEEWEDISMQIAEMNGDIILETASREHQQQLLLSHQLQRQKEEQGGSDVGVESRSASARSQDSTRAPFRTTAPASTAISRRNSTSRQSSVASSVDNNDKNDDGGHFHNSHQDRHLHNEKAVDRKESNRRTSSFASSSSLAAEIALDLEGDEAHGRGELQVMSMHSLIYIMRLFADGRAQLLLDSTTAGENNNVVVDPTSFIQRTASSISSVGGDNDGGVADQPTSSVSGRVSSNNNKGVVDNNGNHQSATTPRNRQDNNNHFNNSMHHVSFDQSVSSLNASMVSGSRSTTTNPLSFIPSHLISEFSELEAAEGRQRQVWANHFINQGLACLLVSMTERLEEVHRMQFIVGCRGGVEAEIADAVGPSPSSSFKEGSSIRSRTTPAIQPSKALDVPPMVDILVNEHRVQNNKNDYFSGGGENDDDGEEEGLVDMLGNLEVLAAVGSSLLRKRQEEAQKAAATRRRQDRNEKREARRHLQEERRRQEEQAVGATTSSSFLLSPGQVERDLMRWETLESEIGGGGNIIDDSEEDEDAPVLVGGAKNALQHLLARAAGHYQSSSPHHHHQHSPNNHHPVSSTSLNNNESKEVLGSLPMLLSLPVGWTLISTNDEDDDNNNIGTTRRGRGRGGATLHLPLRYAGRPSSDISAITAAVLLDTAGVSPRSTKDYLYQHGKATTDGNHDNNNDDQQSIITLAVFSRWHYTQFIIPAILKALREAHIRHSQLLITGKQTTPRRRQSSSSSAVVDHNSNGSPQTVIGPSSSRISSIHSQEGSVGEEGDYNRHHHTDDDPTPSNPQHPQQQQQRSRSQQMFAHRNRTLSSSLPRGGSAASTRSHSMASSVDSSVPDVPPLHHNHVPDAQNPHHQHLQAPYPMLEVTPTSISASRASSQGSNTTFNVVRGASSQQLDISTTSGAAGRHHQQQHLLQHPSYSGGGGAQRTATQGSNAFSPSPRRSASVASSMLIPHRSITSLKQQHQHASSVSSQSGIQQQHNHQQHHLSPRARVVKVATDGDLFSINYSPSSAHKKEENDISRRSQYATIEGSPTHNEDNDDANNNSPSPSKRRTRTAPATFMERKRQLERGESILTVAAANQSSSSKDNGGGGAGSFYKSWSSLSPARGGGGGGGDHHQQQQSSSQLSSPRAKRIYSHLSTIHAASIATESTPLARTGNNQQLSHHQFGSSSGIYNSSVEDGPPHNTMSPTGGGYHTMDESRNAALEAYRRRTDSKIIASTTQQEQPSLTDNNHQAPQQQQPSTAAVTISRNAVVRQLFNKSDTSRNGRLRLSMVVATFRELPEIIKEVEEANAKKRATIGGSDQDGQMILRYNALNELMRITTTPGARGAAALAVPTIREAYQEARREEKLQRRTVNDDGMIGEKGFAFMVLKCLLPSS